MQWYLRLKNVKNKGKCKNGHFTAIYKLKLYTDSFGKIELSIALECHSDYT